MLEELRTASAAKLLTKFTTRLSLLEDALADVFSAPSASSVGGDTNEAPALPLCSLSPQQVASIFHALAEFPYVRVSYRFAWALTWALCCTADRMDAAQATVVLGALRIRRDIFHAAAVATLCEQVIRNHGGQAVSRDSSAAHRRGDQLTILLMFIASFKLHRSGQFLPDQLLSSAVVELAHLVEESKEQDLLQLSKKFFIGSITRAQLPHESLIVPLQRAILRVLPSQSNITMLNHYLQYLFVHEQVQSQGGAALVPTIVSQVLEKLAGFFSVGEDDDSRGMTSAATLTPAVLAEAVATLKTARAIIWRAEKQERKVSSRSTVAGGGAAAALMESWNIARKMFDAWVEQRAWEVVVRSAAGVAAAAAARDGTQLEQKVLMLLADECDKLNRLVKQPAVCVRTAAGAPLKSPMLFAASACPFFAQDFDALTLLRILKSILDRSTYVKSDDVAQQHRIDASLFLLLAMLMMKAPQPVVRRQSRDDDNIENDSADGGGGESDPKGGAIGNFHKRKLFFETFKRIAPALHARGVLAPRLEGCAMPVKWNLLSCAAAEKMSVRCRRSANKRSSNDLDSPLLETPGAAVTHVTVQSLRQLAEKEWRNSNNAGAEAQLIITPRHGSVDFLFLRFVELFAPRNRDTNWPNELG